MDRRVTAGVLLALTFGFTITGYAQEMERSILLEHHQAPMFLQPPGQTYLSRVADVENRTATLWIRAQRRRL